MEKKSTGFCDRKGNELFLKDTVEIFTGDKGEVTFQNSCYGISFDHDISRETISDYAQEENPVFFNNTQFLSFYEILWNWECEENCLPIVIKREKKRSPRRRLVERLVSEKDEYINGLNFDVSPKGRYDLLTDATDEIYFMTDVIVELDDGCEEWNDSQFEALLNKEDVFEYLKDFLKKSGYYDKHYRLLRETMQDAVKELMK